jgi:hypothetical protein
MARRGQRMGRGVNSCMNIAGWSHLFTPNSPEAQAARENCVDYWLGRTSGPMNEPMKKSDFGEDDMPFFTPKNVGIIILVMIGIYYFVIRK